MKKAIQVMATLVAFLLSGQAFAIKVYPTMPPIKDIIGGTATIIADGVKVSGPIFADGFIPAPINKALAVLPETTIASSAISGLAKGIIKGGVAGVAAVAAGYAFDEMLKGVGWVIDSGGNVTKTSTASSSAVSTNYSAGEYSWTDNPLNGWSSSAKGACERLGEVNHGYTSVSVSLISEDYASCTIYGTPFGTQHGYVGRSGSSCPANSSYSVTAAACLATAVVTYLPLVDSDLTVLDGFVKDKDGTWQRDLAVQMCGSLESCYKALSPSTVLTGPTTISGTPQTIKTTAPDGSVSTSVKSPTVTVTYGDNWYDYNPVTTTTTTNNGGTTTTTDDSPETFPNVPDMLGGGNDGLKGIKDGIPGTTSSTSPIPYMPWFSFSQRCSEITLTIPVYGPFSTAICPVYATYIWPTLYFIFAVFTWIRCWGIWRDTVLRVRAS
ncbi:hypothetical protein [Pseudomonas sp. CCC2.2]|uniref:hypothetical protein n=1 Tax=Pseudomonas sp. CCC2.2 TaxID=3048605 RepID=UPI002B23A6A9|nr:hypothetical protein [Pseudomonas sp. CCC2.2]MEB0147539.1 hypothetical protein [Pseudomonas sp. CCC2.2]